MKPDTFLIKTQEINFMTLYWRWKQQKCGSGGGGGGRGKQQKCGGGSGGGNNRNLVVVVVEGKIYKTNEEVEQEEGK